MPYLIGRVLLCCLPKPLANESMLLLTYFNAYEATPKKMGRQLSVIQIVITDTREKTVATGTFTFFMAGPEGEKG